MDASQSEDWEALLSRLSGCITPQEADAVRHAAVDRGSPSHLRQLHNLVAGLLVKHSLTTWHTLQTTFPEYHSKDSGSEQQGQGTRSSNKGEDRSISEGAHNIKGQGSQSKHKDAAATGAADAQSKGTTVSHSNQEGSSGGQKRKAESSLEGVGNDNMRPNIGGRKAGPGKGKKGSTLADHPRAVSWWHPTKNGTNLPKDYKHASTRRVWLQCPGCTECGEVHEWEAKPDNLFRRDFGCPFCTCKGRKFCSCRAISANERLLAEWHEDNPPPTTVTQGSGKWYKWRCTNAACRHVWEANPNMRTNKPNINGQDRNSTGRNCPKCHKDGRNRAKSSSLAKAPVTGVGQ